MRSAVRRILTQRTTVGLSRLEPGFYVHFEMLGPEDATPCLEVTFNPEFVDIDDHRTDVIVGYGGLAELESWLSRLLDDLGVELCPQRSEKAASDSLFGTESHERTTIDLQHPWREWDSYT